ncbi:hypothetical protein B0F90DRAFT_1813749 [Multifurca ochricompacta]|uniref:HMG box domain-containing protein n=1 Tax=Multifurca ochricompacta TaxID=376703 RepID=A0AAD4MBM5_9AGAM|nr:hypothetical protein B0F90DRAFT_1813749 [Multifurca ochricompacta]
MPGTQTPSNLSFSRDLYIFTNLPIPRESQEAPVSFQRPYPYNLDPVLTGGPEVTYQPQESIVPYSQIPLPLRIDSRSARKSKQPPRPSNAFMLFRSDFLKRKFIHKDQETRQHKLSIIIAKCWHKLSKEEKEKWALEAEREKKEHALKYVGYKFQPRARAKTRREPKFSVQPKELDRLCHLADMAYQGILNDDVPQVTRKVTTSPSSTSITLAASPTLLPQTKPTLSPSGSQEQAQPLQPIPLSAGEAGLSVQSLQFPYMTAINPFQNVGMPRGTRGIASAATELDSGPVRPPANSVLNTAVYPFSAFPSQVVPQNSTLTQAQAANPFTTAIYDSGAQIFRGIIRVPLPASLARNSLAHKVTSASMVDHGYHLATLPSRGPLQDFF